MFGIYRTLLAILVVLQHLVLAPFVGSAAVVAFFVLSGYLMTYVMQRSYGYAPGGIARFCTNRFLRLFPSYWASLIICVATIMWVGADAARTFNRPMGIPDDLGGWLANLTMIYPAAMPPDFKPRIAPATWALTIELVFYALIALGISRNRLLTWIWFAAGLSWHIYVVVARLDFAWQYSFIGAGALPFATGALLYHHAKDLLRIVPQTRALLAVGVLGALAAPALVVLGRVMDSNVALQLGIYGNLLAHASIICALARLQPGKWKKLDEVVGDWSYHIYILHWATGLLWAVGVLGMASPERNLSGLVVAGLATLTAIAISLLLTRFVDAPIRSLRAKLRGTGDLARIEPR